MIVKACGALFGGPFNGRVNDKLGGGRSSSIASLITDILAYSSLIICSITENFPWSCYISAFIFGFTESSLITQISVLISANFDAPAHITSILTITKSFFSAFLMMISSSLTTSLSYTIFFLVLGIIGCSSQLLLVLTFEFKTPPPPIMPA